MRKPIFCLPYLLACLVSPSYAQESEEKKWEVSLEAGLRRITDARIDQFGILSYEMPAQIQSHNAYAGAVIANYKIGRKWGFQSGLRVGHTGISYHLQRIFPEQFIFNINVSDDVVSLELPVLVAYDFDFNLVNRPNTLRLSAGPVIVHRFSSYSENQKVSHPFQGHFLANPPSTASYGGSAELLDPSWFLLFGYEAKLQLNAIQGSRWGLGLTYQKMLSVGSGESYSFSYNLDYINHSGGTSFTETQKGSFYATKAQIWMLSVNYILIKPSLHEVDNKGFKGTPRYQQY